jgi:hypothetical protein
MVCAGRFGSLPMKSGVRYRCERLLPSARGHCRPRPASLHFRVSACVCPLAIGGTHAVREPSSALVQRECCTGKGKGCAFHSHDRSRLAAHSLWTFAHCTRARAYRHTRRSRPRAVRLRQSSAAAEAHTAGLELAAHKHKRKCKQREQSPPLGDWTGPRRVAESQRWTVRRVQHRATSAPGLATGQARRFRICAGVATAEGVCCNRRR